jgi:hypothetical protein
MTALAEGLSDAAGPAVQRRCAAALGELLFYAASQQRAPAATGTAASPGGPWAAPPEVLRSFEALLRPGTDEVTQVGIVAAGAAKLVSCLCHRSRPHNPLGEHFTASGPADRAPDFPEPLHACPVQHYATKTLENVFGQGGTWAAALASGVVMELLVEVRAALCWCFLTLLEGAAARLSQTCGGSRTEQALMERNNRRASSLCSCVRRSWRTGL